MEWLINMRCGDCKYFGRDITTNHPDFAHDPNIKGFHECTYIDSDHAYNSDCEKPVFCIDASGYFAAVRVREDFGCAAFEEKKITDAFSLRVDIE